MFCMFLFYVSRKVMKWAMRRKGLPEVIARVVMTIYHFSHLSMGKAKVIVISELSEEF